MKITGYVSSLLKYSSDNNKSPLAFVSSRIKFFLDKFHIPTKQIAFIPVDFNTEHWVEKFLLKDLIFLKIIFLWEGVTLYLNEDILKKIISEIGKTTSKDSIFVFDLYGKTFVKQYDTMKVKKVMTEYVV